MMRVFKWLAVLVFSLLFVGMSGCETETSPCEGAECADVAGSEGADTGSQGADTEASEPVQSAAALAVCEEVAPLFTDLEPIPTDPAEHPGSYWGAQIFLLGLEEGDRDGVIWNSYLAPVTAVDGVADLEFPMAVCPLSFAFKGVRCELWAGGIAAFDYNEVVVAKDYEPCVFSDVPPGSHDVKIELCCFGDCGMGDTGGYGDVWVDVLVE